jgi:hypothetical protein
MARSRHKDNRFLELHHGKWRAVVAVPRLLQKQLGTKLKRSLNTDSRATANTLKWAAVAELRAIIDRAAAGQPKVDRRTDEALEIAAYRARAADPVEREEIDEEISRRADEMRGDPVATEADADGSPVYLYDPEREALAEQWATLASGRATPIAHHHPAFLAAQITKARTKGDDKRAVGFLMA